MNSHRAYTSSDSTLTLWIRDAAGKRSLTGKTLSLHIYQWRGSVDPLASISATSPATGQVTATVSQDTAYNTLGTGLFRYELQATQGSVKEVLESGALEVV